MAPAGNEAMTPLTGQSFAATYALCKVRLPGKILFSDIDKAPDQRTFLPSNE